MNSLRIVVRLRRGVEFTSISCQNTTQKDIVEFIKKTLDAQGISHFLKCKVTEIEVRAFRGKEWKGKTVYFSFRGLSPLQIKKLIVQNVPLHYIPERTLKKVQKGIKRP